MTSCKFAAGALSALLYAQGLLGFAGLATVLLKGHADAAPAVVVTSAAR